MRTTRRVRVPIFLIDAFAAHRFGGNPAAAMVLPSYPDDATLQGVAQENNLAETAFRVRQQADWRFRLFTPTVEVPLCGHATLASSWLIMERLEPGTERVELEVICRFYMEGEAEI